MTSPVKPMLSGILLLFVLAASVLASGEKTETNAMGDGLTADGVAIYIGIMPAEIVLGYPSGSEERRMHGGVPRSDHYHHIMVALFEKDTGKRIDNATITASVGKIGMSARTKTLEIMPINGYVTYGNYFEMPGAGIYRVRLNIHVPGKSAPIITQLDYRHCMEPGGTCVAIGTGEAGSEISTTSPSTPSPPGFQVSFHRDVQPILRRRCVECHQPGGIGYQKSGLDLRTYEGLMAGTKYGRMVIPGDAFSSNLMVLMEGRASAKIRMPFHRKPLDEDLIKTIGRWINEGAKNN